MATPAPRTATGDVDLDAINPAQRLSTPRTPAGQVDVAAIDAIYDAGLGHLLTHSGFRSHQIAQGRDVVANPANLAQDIDRTGNGGGARPTAAKAPAKPASEKQVAFLRKLLAERPSVAAPDFEALSSREASALIDRLLATKPEAPAAGAAPVAAHRGPTEKQAAFIRKLLAERPAYTEAAIVHHGDIEAFIAAHTAQQASDTIASLLALPKEGRAPFDQRGVAAGYYAVEGEDGALKFYRVSDRGVSVQASSDFHRVPGDAATILDKIAVDPAGAAARYGTELGRCGRCNRVLTDETSRAFGIGPDCRSRGW